MSSVRLRQPLGLAGKVSVMVEQKYLRTTTKICSTLLRGYTTSYMNSCCLYLLIIFLLLNVFTSRQFDKKESPICFIAEVRYLVATEFWPSHFIVRFHSVFLSHSNKIHYFVCYLQMCVSNIPMSMSFSNNRLHASVIMVPYFAP